MVWYKVTASYTVGSEEGIWRTKSRTLDMYDKKAAIEEAYNQISAEIDEELTAKFGIEKPKIWIRQIECFQASPPRPSTDDQTPIEELF